SYFESIKVTKGKQNQWFEQFSKEQPRREQALSAWGYLDKIYLSDDIFSIQSKPKKAIKDEKYRIKNEEKKFINSLPKESYVKYYLPIRKLVSTVSLTNHISILGNCINISLTSGILIILSLFRFKIIKTPY
uniref:hypothetical protein n=1 Tax=Flavobacterium sp. TaxID=239 RepID=UPI0040479EF9